MIGSAVSGHSQKEEMTMHRLPRCFVLVRCLMLAALATCSPACAVPDPGAAYLSGNWSFIESMTDKDHPSSCGMPASHGDQIGYEFARSGGRVVVYEVPDLFSYYGGVEVHMDGDTLLLTARTRYGEARELQRIMRKGPDDAQIVRANGQPPITLHRCPGAMPPIAAGISDANLRALTPPITGGQGFPEVFTDEAPSDVCDGKVKAPDWKDASRKRRSWAQFDLIGPGHFWGMLDGPEGSAGFFTILAARQLAPDTVRLAIQRWGAKATDDLTIQIGPDRVTIAELKLTLARCRPDQPGSLGMHRM